MAFRRNRLYRRKRGYKSYNRVRRYNASRRYKRTRNTLSYKVYNLTRKVNRYISTYKPEIQQVRGRLIEDNFVEGEDPNKHFNPICRSYRNLYESTLKVYDENVLNRKLNIIGDLCRSFKLKLFGYFGLCPTDRFILKDGANDYKMKSPYPQECYLKVVVAVLKKGGGRIPASNEVFYTNNTDPASPGFDDLALITGPLNKNITSQLNILRVKTVKLYSNNYTRLFKMNIKVPHYRKRVNANAYGAGEILVYYQLLCPTWFNDGAADNLHTPSPRFTMDYQLFYVDQN